MKPTYQELEMAVVRWSEARKIIPNSTPVAQARKTAEEAAELLEAAAKLQALKEAAANIVGLGEMPVHRAQAKLAMLELKDAVGDVVVTLVNVCALADIDLTECLAGAYSQIKDRKGTLMPSGVFVKEA